MKRFLTALFLMLAFGLSADAAQVSFTVYTNGETLTAANLNLPLTTIYNAFNTNIDNTNINATGLFASNLNPVTSANATFGGGIPYTFPDQLVINGSGGSIGQLSLVDTVAGSPVTPRKILRANGSNGNFEIVNSGNNAVIFSMSDTGMVNNSLPVNGGYVAPAYLASGSTVPSTWHSEFGSCTMGGSTGYCDVTFSGSGHGFTASQDYSCSESLVSGAPGFANDSPTIISATDIRVKSVSTSSTGTYTVTCTGY